MEIQTIKRMVHEAAPKVPFFEKENGVFVLGRMIKGSTGIGLNLNQTANWRERSNVPSYSFMS
jgi:hypothetical protein